MAVLHFRLDLMPLGGWSLTCVVRGALGICSVLARGPLFTVQGRTGHLTGREPRTGERRVHPALQTGADTVRCVQHSHLSVSTPAAGSVPGHAPAHPPVGQAAALCPAPGPQVLTGFEGLAPSDGQGQGRSPVCGAASSPGSCVSGGGEGAGVPRTPEGACWLFLFPFLYGAGHALFS